MTSIRITLLVALVASGVVLAACQPTGTLPPDLQIESLYFETLGRGSSAQVADTTELVFSTQEEWSGFAGRLRPMATFKDTDFEQTMVLVAAVPASSGGYTLEFESVEKIGDEIVAAYVLSEPGFDCVAIMALTQPFHVIAVKRTEGRVRFVRRSVAETCSS
jgi:hypothetical protein